MIVVKPTPHYRIEPISRGSTRRGKVRRPTRLGGSMAARIVYVTRGGDLASRADEVISHGSVGPRMGDWSCVDRAERRKDAIVGRELVSTVPHLLSHEAMDRVGRTHAKEISQLLNVPVYYAVHRASKAEGSDWRNTHIHFDWPAREVNVDGQFGEKTRVLDNRNTSGAVVAHMRARYQDLVNREFVAAGIDQRLDLRSYEAQKLPFEAQTRVPKLEFQRARRGELYSPHYERNHAIIRLRTTTEAVAHAAASFHRIYRNLVAGIVIRRRVARTARRRAAGRSLDCTRTPEPAARIRFQADPGSGNHDGNGRGPKHIEREVRTDLAAASPASQRSGDPVSALDPRRIAGRDRSRRSSATDRSEMGARPEHRESGILTQSHGGLNSPTLLARITRWLTGASSQPFAAVEHRTNTTAHEENSEATTEKKNAQIGRLALEARVSQEATDAALKDDDSTGAIDGPKPLIRITTEAGKIYFMRHEDWQRAKENGARDVPLCEWNGEPVHDGGRKKTMRVSTIPKCELAPMELPNIDELLHHEQDSGLRLGL